AAAERVDSSPKPAGSSENVFLRDSPRLAPERAREQQGDRDRQQPPRVHVLVGQERGQPNRYREARRDAPGVADDEVPPAERKRADVLHAAASKGATASSRRRSART